MRNIISVLQRLWSRCVIKKINSTPACQQVDIALMAHDTKHHLDYLEPYGFTATTHPGSEGVALFLAGDRSHGVVIQMADRRYRLTGLQHGEVALYTDEGDSIVLKRGKVTEAITDTFIIRAKNKIVLDTPQVDTSGEITATQSVISQAEIQDSTGTLSTVRQQYHSHTHPGDSDGTTGQPNQRMN